MEVYEFKLDSEYIRINPTNQDIFLSPYTYTGTICKRSDIILGGNFAKSLFSFQFPIDNEFALRLLNTLTESPITVIIYRNGNVYFKGRVINTTADSYTINVNCDSLYSLIRNAGLNPRISVNCRHTLYKPGCNLNEGDWTSYYSVSGLTGTSLTISGLGGTPDLTSGMAKINGQSRRILSHSSSTIVIEYPFVGTQSGTLGLVRGCNRTETNCRLFNNMLNHGGYSHIPIKNPFSETGAL